MKVSIIIPVYNSEKYLDSNINAILNQDYSNIEIIYVDDGSTDNSLKILKEYASKSKITVLEQKNQGAPAARNKGLKIATGEYVMFFDSDDVLEKNAISKMIKNSNEADLVQGNYNIIDENGDFLRSKEEIQKNETISKKIMEKCILLPPFPCNKLYKRQTIIDNNIKFDDVKIAQDLNFYVKFLAVAKKVELLKENILNYRITTNSISRTYNLKIFDIKNTFNYIQEYLKTIKKENYIDEYLCVAKLEHYTNQLNKIYNYENKKDRIKILNFFCKELKKTDFSKAKLEYKEKLRKIKEKNMLKYIIASNAYYKFKNKK